MKVLYPNEPLGIIQTVVVTPELLEIARQLHTQDNRMTSHAQFLVQSRKRVYGMDCEYADEEDIVWLDEDSNEVGSEERNDLEAQFQKALEPHIDCFTRTAFTDHWETVQPFFTETAAQAFIESNKHRHCYEGLRIEVESAYRNPEWQAVRNFLKGLVPPPVTTTS